MVSTRAAYTVFLVSVITTGVDCEYLNTIPTHILKDNIYEVVLHNYHSITICIIL